MEEERSAILNNVIPPLATELRQRGADLSCVDLRWGVTGMLLCYVHICMYGYVYVYICVYVCMCVNVCM
jgi:hypothetical protein